MLHDTFAAAAELKFLDDAPAGTLGGLGSVWDNIDSHGDIVRRGAFAESLASHKANGTMPRMYAEHSRYTGGDPLPIGVWDEMEETDAGLFVKGRLIGMDTAPVSRIAALLREKGRPMGGLSIAFHAPAGGTSVNRKAGPGEAKREIKRANLFSVDVVADPSNPRAQVQTMKSAIQPADHEAACEALVQAMELQRAIIAAGELPSIEQRCALLEQIQLAHMALTGSPVPHGTKGVPSLREYQTAIGTMFGLSHSEARDITESGLKSWLARESRGREQVAEPDRAALNELRDSLAGFSLPSF